MIFGLVGFTCGGRVGARRCETLGVHVCMQVRKSAVSRFALLWLGLALVRYFLYHDTVGDRHSSEWVSWQAGYADADADADAMHGR